MNPFQLVLVKDLLPDLFLLLLAVDLEFLFLDLFDFDLFNNESINGPFLPVLLLSSLDNIPEL